MDGHGVLSGGLLEAENEWRSRLRYGKLKRSLAIRRNVVGGFGQKEDLSGRKYTV